MKKLTVNHIRKSFRERMVVDGVTMEVQPGEIIGLLGPNGAGKTTTFLMILGVHRPDSGEIRLNDRDITQIPVYNRARLGISFLPQEPSILRGLTVRENIQAIAQMTHHLQPRAIDEILNDLGLAPIHDRKAYMLSGGERRRLEIARSLILTPDFLLLDEPFAGIDPMQIFELQELIKTFKNRGMGIIITDHNVREILKITDRSYIIHCGQVIFEGQSEQLIADKRVKKEYLGEEFRWN
ncbi:MAG: LPS export ABC transporter ATP-binding protein [Candidatus Aminicenantes bacterium]|nr:LPS export ABC transporter ATP-binding protein [Candidatus Aminicenantes bacterium]